MPRLPALTLVVLASCSLVGEGKDRCLTAADCLEGLICLDARCVVKPGVAHDGGAVTTDGGTGDAGREDDSLCVSEHWCWVNPLPQGNDLDIGWAASPSDLWAAGYAATVLHFDGTRWRRVTHPMSYNNVSFESMWGASSTRVWLGGRDYAAPNLGVLMFWDGVSWAVQATPKWAVEKLWGTSATDVFALAGNQLLHYDGTVWSTHVVPGSVGYLTTAWSSAPNDLWVGGERGFIHFDGTTWSPIATGFANLVPNDITGRGANDVWAVGTARLDGGYDSKVLHWDGSTMSVVPFAWHDSLTSVTVDAESVWVSSYDGKFSRWHAGVWSRLPAQSEIRIVSPMISTGTGRGWCFGGDGFMSEWDGTQWIQRSTQHPPGVRGVWGRTANNLWAVTDNGWSIAHFDGSLWDVNTISEYRDELKGPVGSGDDDVWVFGPKPNASRWHDNKWTTYDTGSDYPLYAASAAAPNDVWAMGSAARASHFDGTKWTAMSTGTNAFPSGMFAVSGTAFMVADEYQQATGAIYKLNASGQWKNVTPTPNFPNPSGVFGTASTDVWVTAPGQVWHWNGTTWSRSYSASLSDGGVENLAGGYARSPTDAWVMGNGFVLHFDGTTWSRQPVDLPRFYTVPNYSLWGNADDLRLIGAGMLKYR